MSEKSSSSPRKVKLTTAMLLVLAAATAVNAADGTFERSALKPRSDNDSVNRVPFKHLFSELDKRATIETCDPGYFACNDSLGGCCPEGTSCVSGSFTCSPGGSGSGSSSGSGSGSSSGSDSGTGGGLGGGSSSIPPPESLTPTESSVSAGASSSFEFPSASVMSGDSTSIPAAASSPPSSAAIPAVASSPPKLTSQGAVSATLSTVAALFVGFIFFAQL